jgi:RHS repeat-associated protein
MVQGHLQISRQLNRAGIRYCRAWSFLVLFLACNFLCPATFAQTSATTESPSKEDSKPVAAAAEQAGTGALCQTLSADGQPSCGQEAGNPINVTNGNKFQREVDMPALPGVLGLELVRNYNSASSRLIDAPSMFGRGWRLSYDWALRFDHASKNQGIVLVRGDGTQVALLKNKPSAPGNSNNSSSNMTNSNATVAIQQSWRALNLPAGTLVEHRRALDSEYVWTETSGQRYRFNAKGWLVSIEAPTGEFLSIEREHKGDITKVTDPQGRTLRFSLLSDEVALRTKSFGGAQAVDTPVGRYQYRYGGSLPTGSSVDPVKLLSRLVAVEHAGITRHYLFEDAKQVTFLTGIRVEGAGSDGVMMNQRIASWAYDTAGRANLSMRGEQERVTLLFFPRRKTPQGVETGSTLLTNSLGMSTIYRYQMLAGKPHLTEVLGPGCASCGLTNVRHEYNPKGLLLQTTYLAPVLLPKIKKDGVNASSVEHRTLHTQPLRAIRMSYDDRGRLTEQYLVKYQDGQATTAVPWRRYEYASTQTSTREDRVNQENEALNNKPILIARPSVVPGREHRIEMKYNEHGQLTRLHERGFDPVENRELFRSIVYDYRLIQGRSVLIRKDGPLPNGAMQTPADSDITLYQWDAKGDRIVASTEPLGFSRTLTFDDAGRMTRSIFEDGVRRSQQELVYTSDGRHAMSIENSTLAGWMLDTESVNRAIGAQSHTYTSEIPRIRLLQVDMMTAISGGSTQQKHDALGRPTQTMDASGRMLERGFDDANRVRSVSDPMGNRSETIFDTEGRPRRSALLRAAQSDSLRAAYFWHDEHGRPTKRLLPDGQIDTWRYADDGQLIEHTDGDDVRTMILKAKAGAIEGVLKQATDTDLRFHLALNGAVNRANQVDDFGRIVKSALPDHGDKFASYDNADRLIKLTHADQSSVQYQYDHGGRLLKKHYEDPKTRAQNETVLSYEGVLLKNARDPEQSTETHYDSLGRKTGESVQLKGLSQIFHTRQRYDPKTGLMIERELANGQMMRISREAVTQGASVEAVYLRSENLTWLINQARQYLPIGVSTRIVQMFPDQTLIENIRVDPFDGLTSYRAGNGINSARTFDRAGRLTKQVIERVSTTSYEYQVGPRIRAIEQNRPDDLITLASSPTQVRTQFEYSGFGALLQKNTTSNLLTIAMNSERSRKEFALTDGSTNLPAIRKLVAPVRDASGRTIDDGYYRYSYSSRGQLSELRNHHTNKLIASYRYDSQGHRIAKTLYSDGLRNSEQTTYFLWHDNLLAAELDAQGRVTSQYFYLNSDGQKQIAHATPIAKWESQDNSNNPSKKDRLLFIHSDHRGAPIAVTNSVQSVVWAVNQADNSWGSAQPSGASRATSAHKTGSGSKQVIDQSSIILNLRLPGQYYDAESGLHDNLNRSYQPMTGEYLQPDPLGYPDGPSAYRYASGDPINKIDPYGLYDIEVHYYLNYFLAKLAGLSNRQALTISLAAQYVDDNELTKPENKTNLSARTLYHFVMAGNESKTDPETRFMNPSTDQLKSLRAPLGYDFLSICQKSQFFGEYLHVFADTFSHRDEENVPYSPGIGHTTANHDADETFNVRGFQRNEARTLQMEKEVFASYQRQFELSANDKQGFPIVFEDFASTMISFNLAGKPAGNAAPKWQDNCLVSPIDCDKAAYAARRATEIAEKTAILNRELASLGFDAIPAYSLSAAAANRSNFLGALRHRSYPGIPAADPFLGIMLPSDDCLIRSVNVMCPPQ